MWPRQAHPEVAAIITVQRALVDEMQRRLGRVIPFVFPNPAGGPLKSVSGAFTRAIARARLSPELTPHCLRRSAARNMERAGVPRSVAMKLCGWKTEAMYQRYRIVASSVRAEEAADFWIMSQIGPTLAQ